MSETLFNPRMPLAERMAAAIKYGELHAQAMMGFREFEKYRASNPTANELLDELAYQADHCMSVLLQTERKMKLVDPYYDNYGLAGIVMRKREEREAMAEILNSPTDEGVDSNDD
jgi:hypothetical protein